MSAYYMVVIAAVFIGVVAFVFVGIQLFSQRWESYEEKYGETEEASLETLLLTIPPEHVIYLSFLFGFLGFCIGFFAFWSVPAGAVFGLVFIILPKVALNIYIKKRQEAFANQLVDALSSLSNSLRAGFSLPKALEVLSVEAPNPMAQEMKIVVQEMRVGESLVDALRNLEERMPNEDLDLMITAISIAGELGGNLTEIFENIAHTIRERQKIEGKVKALTSQGKAQGFVVGMLPVILGLAVSTINPELFRPMYTTIFGWVLIGVVIILEIIGMMIIKKIVTIRV